MGPNKTDRLAPRRNVSLGLCLLACCLGLAWTGCGGDDRPSVILVIMDTTRHDRLGCTGYERATTPTLDSLATSGVRFANCVTAAPVTGPAITTILSSALPPVHGVRDNRRFVLNEKLGLLAESFRDAGYQTGAVVGAVPLLARFGYDRGFTSYDDDFAADPYRIHDPVFAGQAPDLRESERRATAVTERALNWLQQSSGRRPCFLLAHYFDPHGPFDPPPLYAALHPADPYDAEIAYMDAEIGRLLAGARGILGGAEKVRVVAVADHGEGLFEHNEMAHGFFVYDSTVKVPLIFSGTAASPGLTVTGAMRTIDIAPTVCGWCGVTPPATFSGQDLTTALNGAALPAACDTAYVETFWTQLHYSWAPLQCLRTTGWKWIKAPRPELYALGVDPAEAVNLAGSGAPAEPTLRSRLEAFLAAAAVTNQQLGASRGEIDPDLERRLQALGYVSGQQHDSVVPNYDLPDPKDGNRQWNPTERRQQHLQAARLLYQHERVEDAAQRLRLAAEIEPLTRSDAALLGLLLSQTRQFPAALDAYERAFRTESEPDGRAFIRLEMIRLLIALDRQDTARAHLDTLCKNPSLPASILELLPRLAAQLPESD
ncbi:MAG: sulfatase-like hydrolase/transferase [bacterium]